MVICWCDGGAKPNPGDCYGSFRITGFNNGIITERFEYCHGTNNQAEYWTLIELLKYLYRNGVNSALIRMDSDLILKQIHGKWVVRSEKLLPLWKEARGYINLMPGIEFEYIHNKKMKMILGH